MSEILGLNYKQAIELVDKCITDPVTKLHLKETEAIMRALAKKFGEDEEVWGVIGLLHDIDWNLVKGNEAEHCILAQSILKEAGASDFLVESVVSHGYSNESIPKLLDKKRTTKLQHCLVAAETLTGIIIAATLVQPEKKLSNVSLPSLIKKFKSPSFAARCNRDLVKECEEAGITLDDFLQIGLLALQGISEELGL